MLPVKKTSKSRTRTRRSHHALKPANYSICPKCGKAKMSHGACDCGYVNRSLTLNLSGK